MAHYLEEVISQPEPRDCPAEPQQDMATAAAAVRGARPVCEPPSSPERKQQELARAAAAVRAERLHSIIAEGRQQDFSRASAVVAACPRHGLATGIAVIKTSDMWLAAALQAPLKTGEAAWAVKPRNILAEAQKELCRANEALHRAP